MSERPTPRTDAVYAEAWTAQIGTSALTQAVLNKARTLERQRDEAREKFGEGAVAQLRKQAQVQLKRKLLEATNGT